MPPPSIPRVLIVAGSPLRERIAAALGDAYAPVGDDDLFHDIALTIADERGWRAAGAESSRPVIVVRETGASAPPGADAGIRAGFEPAELRERVETLLELARLRANSALKEEALSEQVEDSRGRLRFLVEAVEAMAEAHDLDETLRRLCAAAVPRLGQWCSISLRRDGRLVTPRVWHADPERRPLLDELAPLHASEGDRRHPVHRVLSSGRSECVVRTPGDFARRLATSETHLRLLRELDIAAYMCVPLIARGRTIGTITLGADSGWRRLSLSDLVLAEQLAERAAVALEKASLLEAAARELAERRRAEAEQAMILDTVRAMIWYKDRSNRILRCNRAAAAWLGKTVEEVRGRRAEDLFPAARARAYHANDLAVMASGRPSVGVLEKLRARDGQALWVQRDILPCRDAQGAIIGVIIIAVDVTAHKRAESVATVWAGALRRKECSRTSARRQ